MSAPLIPCAAITRWIQRDTDVLDYTPDVGALLTDEEYGALRQIAVKGCVTREERARLPAGLSDAALFALARALGCA